MKSLLYRLLNGKRELLGRDVKVSLLGFGSTNRAIFEALLPLDNVEISIRQREPLYSDLPSSVKLYQGDDAFNGIDGDVIIPSPSVRRERLAIPYGIEAITDYDLLFRQRSEKLFLISGSDGKSTTTTLSSLMMEGSFTSTFTGGNLGTPLINASIDTEAFILELSSFTLRYSLPNGGRSLLTNVTPNHLDWHDSLEEYEETKLSLIRHSDEPILNLDDTVLEREARRTQAFCLMSGTRTHSEISKSYRTEHTVTEENGYVKLDGKALIPISKIRRNEKHNLSNFRSAVAMSIGYTDVARISEVARTFGGLEERCEEFYVGGVRYLSSSIDTTPERTATTLTGLCCEVNIILGGRGKRLPLEPLRSPLIKYARRISLYGEVAEEMREFIDSDEQLRNIPHQSFLVLSDAIDHATNGVTSGDTILLSPAATSYGEFRDYRHRGSFFKNYIVNKHGKI